MLAQEGAFQEPSKEQVLKKIRVIVKEIDAQTEIISDSASNLLNINGRLPDDRPEMLDQIDRYLTLSSRDKLLFSLQSRLQSFMGQYGGLSDDIARALACYTTTGDYLNLASATDEEIEHVIRLIRAKLMP